MADPTINFGLDTGCTDGLRSGQMVSGARLVAEACYRRLTTPRGMLRGGDDEANYGLDLSELIGQVDSPATVAAIPGQIKAELLKDERLISVDVSVVPTVQGPASTYQISILGHTDVGPFTLVLAVSAVTIDLLGLQAA